jgi:hypothetical protein
LFSYETAQEDVKKAIGLRVFNMLKNWIEKAWHDFDKDAALPERCMDFLDRCISSNDPLKGVATGIRANLVRKKSGDEATVTKAATNPPPVLIGPRENSFTNLMDLNAEEIARQLTLIEWDIWVKIQPWECLGLSWTKKNKETAAPNVLALINRFNVVSGWVATVICTLESPKKRTKAIGKFLEVAGHLMTMGNVNAVMEVVSGLGRGAVFRLKQTWEGLTSQQRKTYEEVKKLTDRSLSYANLRAAVKKLNPPCIPYLGMYLTDLTFIEEGNKDFLNNLINWNKRHLISETIRQIRQYQLQAYVFTPVPWLQTNLREVTVLTEDELYELSEWLEVRPGKERGPKPQLLVKIQKEQEAAAAAAAAAASPSTSAASSSGGSISRGTSAVGGASLKGMAAQHMDSLPLETGHNWPFYEPDSPINVDVDPMTNVVRSGTLVKIVERLTHNSVNPDSNSLFGFLACYRSFSNANEVLDLLISRWSVPPPKDRGAQDTYNSVMLKPIQLRVFNFLKTWLDRHYSDFESNAELKAKLKAFISGPMQQGNEGYAKVLTNSLTKQEQAAAALQNQSAPGSDAPAPITLPPHVTNPSLLDLSGEEFARQLTLIHHRTFVAIRTEELLEQVYRSLDKDTKAKHVVALQAHYHYLFTFSKNELLTADAHNNSGAVASKLLEIVSRLTALRNNFGARAIIEGIDQVLKSKPQLLDNVTVDAKNTFTENKDALVQKASTKVNISPPMVLPLQPFFTEITSAEAGLGAPLPDKRINFEKRLVISDSLIRLITYQKLQYSFHEVPAYVQFFVSHKVVNPVTSGGSGPVGSGFAPMASSSPNSSFVPRMSSSYGGPNGSISSFGSGSGTNEIGAGADNGPFKFFMMDCVLNDEDIKHEIQDIAGEVYRMNLALIQDEIRKILAGKPAAKLPLAAPAPKAAMPVYAAPMVNPMLGHIGPTPGFTAATGGGVPGVSGAAATAPMGIPTLGSSFAANPTFGGSAPTLLPPANLGHPAYGKMSTAPPATMTVGTPPGSFGSGSFGSPLTSTFGSGSLGPSPFGTPLGTNPALANPALANPALGNPALGNPALGNPALGNPALGNPALGMPVNNNPGLVNSPSSGMVSSISSPSLANSGGSVGTGPGVLPTQAEIPVRPVPGGKMPPGLMKIPPGVNTTPKRIIPGTMPPATPPAFTPPGPPTSAPPSVPPSAAPPAAPAEVSIVGGMVRSDSAQSLPTPSPTPPPEIPATPPPSGPRLSSEIAPSEISLSESGGINIPGPGSDEKKTPLPAFPKSRQSFTSASKQASIRDLMAGLGKISPSGSNPSLRGPNPLSGSGSFPTPNASASQGSAGTPPGTPGGHSRSNSNNSLTDAVTGSLSPSSSFVQPPTPEPSPSPAQQPDLRSLASQQLAIDFPSAQLVQWSGVEPGTNETLVTDLLKTERASHVCSINPSISVTDINNLVRVGKLFKQQNPTLPLACIVLTFNIDAAANELAGRYKMKVYQLKQ